jgi:hypothetical protein
MTPCARRFPSIYKTFSFPVPGHNDTRLVPAYVLLAAAAAKESNGERGRQLKGSTCSAAAEHLSPQTLDMNSKKPNRCQRLECSDAEKEQARGDAAYTPSAS